ncbi:MAG: hypothetical protein MJZ37_10500 [Bacilli bacterium]|nr:hypothetical protein [Bacilli bacterium]
MAGLDDFLFNYLDTDPSQRKYEAREAYNKYYNAVKEGFNGDRVKADGFVQKTLGTYILQDRASGKGHYDSIARDNIPSWDYYHNNHKPFDKSKVNDILKKFPSDVRQAFVDFIANDFYYEGVDGNDRQILVDLIIDLGTMY